MNFNKLLPIIIFGLFGCSAIGHKYDYVATSMTGWTTNGYGTCSYSCGDLQYRITPKRNVEFEWMSPVPIFPYVIPSYLIDNKQDEYDKLRVVIEYGNRLSVELESIQPILKLANGRLLTSSGCDKWVTYKLINGIARGTTCKFPVYYQDIAEFTMLFNDGTSFCNPQSLDFKQKVTKFYSLFGADSPTIPLK